MGYRVMGYIGVERGIGIMEKKMEITRVLEFRDLGV